jgi:hypothetical protein
MDAARADVSWCLVPANSFAEYAAEPDPMTKKENVVWFALNEERPLFRFRGPVDDLQRRAGHEVKDNSGAASGLWLLDNGTECGCRADPSDGDAGDPDHR